VVGVPVSAPVVVLKLIPGGVALIAKLVMAGPVEIMVKPVATVLLNRVSDEEERVKTGGCGALTVNVNVCVVDPSPFVAVIVYTVAGATVVGVPVSAPVDVLKLIPGGVALIAKLVMAGPVEILKNPVAAVLAALVSDEAERVKTGGCAALTVNVNVCVAVSLARLKAVTV
jgi:hypothetical protein